MWERFQQARVYRYDPTEVIRIKPVHSCRQHDVLDADLL
jgi:hypothetical protein